MLQGTESTEVGSLYLHCASSSATITGSSHTAAIDFGLVVRCGKICFSIAPSAFPYCYESWKPFPCTCIVEA